MASDPVRTWEILFRHARELIEDARRRQIPVDRWTFGGGTVLMRRHRHRLSKDVDIFIDDPQFIGYLTPRLSPVAEALTTDYAEDANYVKLRFPEGEVDFVVSAPLTSTPTYTGEILGAPFLVEYSGEIIAKKVWHRGQNSLRATSSILQWWPSASRTYSANLRPCFDRDGMKSSLECNAIGNSSAKASKSSPSWSIDVLSTNASPS